MKLFNYIKRGDTAGVLSEIKNINILEDMYQLQLTDECEIQCSYLQHAVLSNQLNIVKVLLENGANPLALEHSPSKGQCPLSMDLFSDLASDDDLVRVENKQIEHDRFFSKSYLEQALNTKLECPITRKPLSHIHISLLPTYYSALTTAARLGYKDIFNVLLDSAHADADYQSLACIAIINKQHEILESIKLRLGADELSKLLSELSFKQKPLYQSLLEDKMFDALTTMLKYITQVSHLDGNTALSFALGTKEKALISQVLTFDQRFDVVLPSGETPLNKALSFNQDMNIDQIEGMLKELSPYVPVSQLFKAIPKEAIIKAYEKKYSASPLPLPMLVYPYFNNNILIAEYLISQGYGINELAGETHKWFPLLGALEGPNPQLETLNAVLSHPDIDVNISTEQGKTALMASILRKLPWATERLLQVKRIDVNFVSSASGETALIIAIRHNTDMTIIR